MFFGDHGFLPMGDADGIEGRIMNIMLDV